MIGHMTGRGAEHVAAEGCVRGDVAQQMTGREQLGRIDNVTDLHWNGRALLLGVSLMMSAAAAPMAPHGLV